MRMRRKRNLSQRLEAVDALMIHQPETLAGRWLDSFPGYTGLHLEIGCGKGNFLLGMSPRLPETLLIGLECVPDALVMAMEKAAGAALPNVRFLLADAANAARFFMPGEVQRLYLNFSTPWPSRRHEKRRLTHPAFLQIYRQLLPPGGQLWLKTDDRDFFHYSLKTLAAAGFSLHQVTEDLHSQPNDTVVTEYERRFLDQGLPIFRCEARKEEVGHADGPAAL